MGVFGPIWETYADLEQADVGADWCRNDQKSLSGRACGRRDGMTTMMQPCRVIVVCIFEVHRKRSLSEVK